MTKTEAKRLAVKARRYGYFDTTNRPGGKLIVRCPVSECRKMVETDNHYPYNKLKNLDRAVVEHLTEEH